MTEIVARLIEVGEAQGTRAHPLTPGVHVLGRDAGLGVVTLDHADVSRRHAELLITHDGATIRDLASKNGLVVDGRKVSEAALEHGARVAFGEFVVELEHGGARVDRLLARSGELTVRRPRVPSRDTSSPAPASTSTSAPSLALPLIVTLAFTLMITALLVLG